MKQSVKITISCGTVLLLTACASTPMGPTVRAMPPQGKPFEAFQEDQAACKQYADSQVQGQADRANSTGVLEGVGGTILGAGLGAALGGGHGAAVGAGVGALGGTAVGASTSSQAQHGIQQQYNDAYAGCMTSKGNQIQQPVVYRAPPPPPPSTTTIIYNSPPPPPPPTVVYTSPPPPGPPPGAYPY